MIDSFMDMRRRWERGEYTPEKVVFFAVKHASSGADSAEMRSFCRLLRDAIPLIQYPARPSKFADLWVPEPWQSVKDVYAYVTHWCEDFVGTIDWLREYTEEKSPQRAADKLEERAAAVMADAPVLAEPRRPTKEEQADKGVVNTVIRGSTNATYLAARLKRDNPEIAAAVSRGEFKSMRKAAIAAGIVREKTRLEKIQTLFSGATADEKREIREWVSNQPE
jgi:hypothetical protein